MTDVAELAGVSQATVSYVVNGIALEKRIPIATQQRIEAACRDLDYKRDYLATAMATKQTRVIGMLFANVLGEFMNGIIKGAQDYLRKHDRHVVLCTCDDDSDIEETDLEMLDNRCADGIICFPVETADRINYWDQVLANGPPIVFVDHLPSEISGECVQIDDFAIGAEAAKHFNRAGIHQTIVLQMPGSSATSVLRRQDGFMTELQNLKLPPACMVDANNRKKTEAVLHSQDKLGVFAAVSGWLTDAMRPIMRSDAVIGKDVMFASIGRCPEADFVQNSWWVAEQSEKEMGSTAAQRLLHRLDEGVSAPRTLILPVKWRYNNVVKEPPKKE